MGSNSNNPQYLTTRGPDKSFRCIFVGCFIFLWIVSSTNGSPITTTTERISHVTKLGYLSTTSRDSTKDLDAKTRTQALKDFIAKEFTGLNITGRQVNEIKYFMALPPCDARGKVTVYPPRRLKRYVLHGKKFTKMQLTYRIHNFPWSLPKATVEYEIARAFDIWSKVTNLTFTPKKEGSADINISFFEGNHGDGVSLNGTEVLLAYAAFPGNRFEGTVHFNDAEYWSSQSEFGYNLFQVAVHEFGHTLGLKHSQVRTAVMWPDYRKYDPNFQLDEDDIYAIQLLYGINDVLLTMALIKEAVNLYFQADIFLKQNSNHTKIN